MNFGRFDTMSLAAGICLTLAMPLAAAAQQQPQTLRYQPPAGMQMQPMMPTLPPLAPVTLGGQATVVEGIVARVNDKVITSSDMLKAEQELQMEMQQQHLSPAQMVQQQRDMLRDMIDKALLLSRGKDLEINVDTDVVKQLDDIRKQNNMPTMEALQKAVTDQGISYEDFKAQIHDSLVTQQVIRDEVARHLQQPTHQQELDYYNAHQEMFQQPEQVALSEIIVSTPATATDAEVAQAKAKADSIETELKAGANFEDEAKKLSGGPTAAQGGVLGVYKRGVLGPVFDDATFGLPVGGLAAPIRTRQGYVILKVTQHIAAGLQPLQSVEGDIQEAMFREEMQPAVRTYLTKLRDNAFIDIAAGYTDTGRSPNETKVSFAAATPPPAPKAKKSAQRFDRTASAGTATGARAVPSLPPASANNAVSGPTLASATKPGKKPKKIRREKIRYGQAPRNSLAPGTAEIATSPSSVTPGAPVTLQPTVAADTSNDTSNDTAVNPLEPQAAPQKKVRFASTEPYHGPKKPKKLTAKDKEKILAKPTPMTAQETAQQKVQAEALGVNGDTVKKQKKVKVKKVKGQPAPPAKERIQERPAPTGPVQPAPTVNPNLGAPIQGTTTPSSDTATPAAK